MTEEPVSRFWACVFANGLGALFWTLKMKKTPKWLAVSIGFALVGVGILTAGFAILTPVDEINQKDPWRMFFGLFLLAGYIFPMLAPPIYFMLRWTTEFNTRVFGYKSKADWKRAGSSAPPPRSEWFK